MNALPPLALLGVPELDVAVRSTIVHAAANAPRSLQTAIGPSEVGQECLRRLAYKITGTPAVSDGGDHWRPTVGTAAHAWLADALHLANTELGYRRWVVEERVTIADDLAGACDAFDLDTGTVIDWKVVGPTSLKKQAKACRPGGDGPGAQYRTQVHLYGAGHVNSGRDVNHVAIVFLPSAGTLADAVFWTEPYDYDVARTALGRLSALRAGLGAGLTPDQFPATPVSDRMCLYCPFYRYGSTDLATGCPGIESESTWLASLPKAAS